MYIPSSFREENPEKLYDFIEEYSFGVLFSQHQKEAEATHLPFMVDRDNNRLYAHFSRANKHWECITDNEPVLVVFHGPHTYISPDWYEQKDTVPTWNYAAVHVKAKPVIIHEKERLRSMVDQLTHHHEEMVDSEWDYEAAHPKRDRLLKAIVGIQLEILEMEGTFKFNQNRSQEDQKGVIEALSSSKREADQAVAEVMKNTFEDEV
ncbi:MAG: FMN-binding negative transcriptional regulator [Balneolaceae bacterium]|nr:FMN-binding negative transcriptional regulator [Balneolaceae bacterium]